MVSPVVYESAKFVLFGAVLVFGVSAETEETLVRLPRQAHGKGGQSDQSSAETGFLGGGGVENSKYFHYQHLPEHDKYEFGHRRGNEHHVVERYEKANPHEGQFKTKVRWADKKGGHGEHYWDYNHAGHGGNGGQNDGDGGYSDPVPVYSAHQQSPKQHHKRQLNATPSESSSQSDSVDQEKAEFVDNFEREIGGIQKYDIQKESGKQKRQSNEPSVQDSHLFFDVKTGKVVDELTGKKYVLQPVN